MDAQFKDRWRDSKPGRRATRVIVNAAGYWVGGGGWLVIAKNINGQIWMNDALSTQIWAIIIGPHCLAMNMCPEHHGYPPLPYCPSLPLSLSLLPHQKKKCAFARTTYMSTKQPILTSSSLPMWYAGPVFYCLLLWPPLPLLRCETEVWAKPVTWSWYF